MGNIPKKSICITGVAGFIGSHIGEHLINHGLHVIGIDNFDNFYPKSVKINNLSSLIQHERFRFFEADIRNKEKIATILSDNRVDLLIHLAAKAGVRPSLDSASEYFDVNVQGTLVLLEAMRSNNISKMIFASSSSVYGNNVKIPFSESDVVDYPISPYAASKKSAELLCHVYSHLYNFDITCLRFFTVYGPRQRPDLAIHKFTKYIQQGKPLPFYGNGHTARDYTYIEDIIKGIQCAIDHLHGYHIYNLGESRMITLNELLHTIEDTLGKKAVIENRDTQPGDVQCTFADISKAINEINYHPEYEFKAGVEKFVEWYLKNEERLNEAE